MPRKDRSDIRIGNLEKKLGLAKGAIRNPDGTDARSDKKLGTLRKEYQALYGSLPVRKNAGIMAATAKPRKTAVATIPKAATTAAPAKKAASKPAAKPGAPKKAAAGAVPKAPAKKTSAGSATAKKTSQSTKAKK